MEKEIFSPEDKNQIDRQLARIERLVKIIPIKQRSLAILFAIYGIFSIIILFMLIPVAIFQRDAIQQVLTVFLLLTLVFPLVLLFTFLNGLKAKSPKRKPKRFASNKEEEVVLIPKSVPEINKSEPKQQPLSKFK